MITGKGTLRLGALVMVRRGGSAPPWKRGCSRRVKGVVVGRDGPHSYRVMLLEDDSLSTIPEWSKAGDIGSWGSLELLPQRLPCLGCGGVRGAWGPLCGVCGPRVRALAWSVLQGGLHATRG